MVARALWRSEALRVVPWLRPSLAYGSCRVSDQAQPCVPLISTMHREPFLIPLTFIFRSIWILDPLSPVFGEKPTISTSLRGGSSDNHRIIAKTIVLRYA